MWLAGQRGTHRCYRTQLEEDAQLPQEVSFGYAHISGVVLNPSQVAVIGVLGAFRAVGVASTDDIALTANLVIELPLCR